MYKAKLSDVQSGNDCENKKCSRIVDLNKPNSFDFYRQQEPKELVKDKFPLIYQGKSKEIGLIRKLKFFRDIRNIDMDISEKKKVLESISDLNCSEFEIKLEGLISPSTSNYKEVVMEGETNKPMSSFVQDSENPQEFKYSSSMIMGETFELLSPQYSVTHYLGMGAYGTVCAVTDATDNSLVAVKKCKKIFQSRTMAKRMLREVRLLRQFNHENIIKIRSIQPPKMPDFSELYVIFEIMEADLAQIIRSPQLLSESHVQYFSFQLLSALEYLHTASVVHRDIK
jgi:hypothetical protein